MPITILDYVRSVAGEKDTYTAFDFASAGVEMIGGCTDCCATLGPGNAYPTRSGYWRCADCVGTTGFASVGEFTSAEFLPASGAHPATPALHDLDGPWINCPSCGSENVREIADSIFECCECETEYTL